MNARAFLYVRIAIGQIIAFFLAALFTYGLIHLPSNHTTAKATDMHIGVTPSSQLTITIVPTDEPTGGPTPIPTVRPSPIPTPRPTIKPTHIPTTSVPIIVPPTNPPPKTASVVANTGNGGLTSIESEMVTLINQKRGSLPPLSVNAQLVEAARRESRDNAARGSINDCSHTGSDGSDFSKRAKDAGYSGFAYGETIGCGHSSAQSIVDGWWNSPGHHDILTNGQITKIGVGWATGNHTAQTAVVGN